MNDQAGIAEALNGKARLNLMTGRFQDALALASRSTDIARRYEQIELLWESLTLAGIAHRRIGETAVARSAFLEAVAVIERLRKEVAGRPLGRERFFETKLSPYHQLVDLALEEGAPVEALEVAERSKARVLAEMFQSGDAGSERGTSSEERAREQRLRMALLSINRRLMAERTGSSPDDGRIRELEETRQEARAEYEAFQVALYAKHPDLLLRRGAARPFSFTEAEDIVRPASMAVLEYVVADEGAYLFVLTRRHGKVEVEAHRLGIDRESLARQVDGLRRRLAARDLLFAEEARRLYDLLLAPAARAIAGKSHLVIVPDGPLWEAPFQALRDASGRYVIRSAAISYAPSLAILRDGLREAPRPNDRPTLLAMGKAEFGTGSVRAATSPLDPLPEAERQVRILASLYGSDRSTVYLGDEATEERFKSEAPRHRIVHLASHGLLDEASPLYSSLVLSAGGDGSREDGLLEAWEMLDLDLDAEIVVLSACETGRGRVASGEGIVGTLWALFAAGAEAAVVTQWKVEAGSAAELMTSLHRGLARGEGKKAEDLRRAALSVLENPRYAHPFYWAPFILVGNPF